MTGHTPFRYLVAKSDPWHVQVRKRVARQAWKYRSTYKSRRGKVS